MSAITPGSRLTTPELQRRAVILYTAGQPLIAIQRLTGAPYSRVKALLIDAGITPRGRGAVPITLADSCNPVVDSGGQGRRVAPRAPLDGWHNQ